jgi:hypothetical protein
VKGDSGVANLCRPLRPQRPPTDFEELAQTSVLDVHREKIRTSRSPSADRKASDRRIKLEIFSSKTRFWPVTVN